jgi:LPS-assembly lipoprotein
VGASPNSALANEFKRSIASGGNVSLIDASGIDSAQVVLDVLTDQREKVVVGLNASGQVREFQLRTRLKFKLRTPQGKELIPETELLQQRDISFNESAVLAKEAEENLLYRDMQADIVQQLMRRLAAVKTL